MKLVYGDTDDVEMIESEALKANIVIHTAGSDDHEPSAKAIVRGLERRRSKNPAYYIHTSGAFALAEETISTGRYGEAGSRAYDDYVGLYQLVRLPDNAPHRLVDKIVLAANPEKVRTAIISPSVVYGEGRGPDKTRFPAFFETFLKEQRVFGLGSGSNIWHNVHVQDLSQMYLLLAEAAADEGGNASWNNEGYYLAENGKYVQHEMLQLVAQVAHNKWLIPSPDIRFLSPSEAGTISPWLKIMLGADSQGGAIRAKKLLDWVPQMPSFEEEIPSTLEAVAKMLGLER